MSEEEIIKEAELALGMAVNDAINDYIIKLIQNNIDIRRMDGKEWTFKPSKFTAYSTSNNLAYTDQSEIIRSQFTIFDLPHWEKVNDGSQKEN